MLKNQHKSGYIMLTKSQWKRYCSMVRMIKLLGYNPTIRNKTVMFVDNYCIKCRELNERQVTVYSHKFSIADHTKLSELYSSLTFRDISLQDIQYLKDFI